MTLPIAKLCLVLVLANGLNQDQLSYPFLILMKYHLLLKTSFIPPSMPAVAINNLPSALVVT